MGGLPNILLEREDKPEKGRGVATFLLLYSSIASTVSVCVYVCVCVGGGGGGVGGGGGGRGVRGCGGSGGCNKVSFITFWFFSLLS